MGLEPCRPGTRHVMCSDLQTSASGIANIGGACARSLQLGIRRQRKITANRRKLIATGIANIRSVRGLIATGGLMMGRKTVVFLPGGSEVAKTV